MSSVFGNSLNFPKQELAKIDFSLISRYLAYEIYSDTENQQIDTDNIGKKIIQRINFFSEEFPFKIIKLEKIIQSKKIFVFGYDTHSRITFYIKPNHYFKNDITLEKIDYVIYIFFIIEHVLPILKEKYNFMDEINMVIDFNNGEGETDLTSFIMHFLNSYYPMILGKLHVIEFNIKAVRNNKLFVQDMRKMNPYPFQVNILYSLV